TAASSSDSGSRRPWPRRRASIAASIRAHAAGRAVRYRSSSAGPPARYWEPCPCSACSAAWASRGSPVTAEVALSSSRSVPVKASGIGMSVPVSKARAWACRSSLLVFGSGGCVEGVPVRRPDGAQDQDWAPGRVAQQVPQRRSDLFPQGAGWGAQVVLGVVQPHHGPRPEPGQALQQRLGPIWRKGVPQPPLLLLLA